MCHGGPEGKDSVGLVVKLREWERLDSRGADGGKVDRRTAVVNLADGKICE